jgi:hypothetical protein
VFKLHVFRQLRASSGQIFVTRWHVQINQHIIIFSGCYIKAKTPTCHMVLENPEKSIQSPRKSHQRDEIGARATISFGFSAQN